MEQKQKYETNVVKPQIAFEENGQSYRVIKVEDELFMDGKIEEMKNYIQNNHGLGLSDQEKDVLYEDAIGLWLKYVENLRNMKYTFYFNRKQYNFITKLLNDKLEYDVNTVYYAIELNKMLGEWELSKEEKKSKTDNILKPYTLDSTDVTYMYHLISPHKVRGLKNEDTYTFVEFLNRIGFISKIVSFYDGEAKYYKQHIMDWVATFEESVTVEGKEFNIPQKVTAVQQETLTPSTK